MLIFGQCSGFLSTVAVVAALMSGGASAQSLRNSSGPAEFPPSSFTANQYVDSRGCVFVRAGIGGTVNWVPRVNRSRDQLCGFQPTQVAGSTTISSTANVPNPLDTPVAGLTPRPAAAPVPVPAPAPVIAATPAPRVNLAPNLAPNLPTSTAGAINPLTGQRVGTPAAPRPVVAATPSPRIITTPTTQPRVLTRAQACAGLTGVQPNLIGQRTGQPINCGGTVAPQIAAATRPSVQAPSALPRVSRTQACADIDATGRSYVSATTGLPIRCGPQTQRITPRTGPFAGLQADLLRPQRPYSNPLDAAPGSMAMNPGTNNRLATPCGAGGLNNTSGFSIRCGPQAKSPSGLRSRLEVPAGPAANGLVTRARTSPSGQGFLGDLFNQNPPPYSNPVASDALSAPTVPTGYTRVWGDGRLNTQRGIRVSPEAQSPSGLSNTIRYATAARATPAVQQPRVATRTAPQAQQSEQISGHRYVQVGTFGTRDQAQSIAQSLRTRGLPMRVGVFNQNGTEMRLVLAGPFSSDAQLQSALGTARGAGYSGAFTRR
jgi:hypothetical protein